MRGMFGIGPRVHPSGAETTPVSPDKPADDRFNPSTHPSTGNIPRARNNSSGLARVDSEAWVKPLKLGAVNANNEVEARTLKSFAESMLADIDRTARIISAPEAGRNELDLSLKRRLLHETKKIQELLIDCINLEYAHTENIHLYLREKFDKINECTKNIAGHIPAKHKAKNRPAGAPVTSEAFLSDLFSDFRQFSKEVKRHHFTRGNDKQLEDFADKEYRRILGLVPGLALQRKGSEMEYVRAQNVSLLLGHDAFGLKFGFEGKFTHAWAKKILIDQCGAHVSTQLRSFSFMGSAVLKLGSLFPVGGTDPGHLAKLMAYLQVKHSRGVWNEYKSLKDWKKAEIIYKGGQLKHRLRSGDPNSWGTRQRQKLHRAVSFVLGDIVGIKYIAKDLIPAVNQKKREKGSYNQDRLEALSKRISEKLPRIPGAAASSLATLTGLAYPPINKLIPRDGGKSSTALTLDDKQFSCLVDPSSMPGPAMSAPREKGTSVRRNSISGKIEGSFDALDWIRPEHGQIHVGARGSGEFEWSNSHTDFFRLKAVHEHLDPRYSNDVDHSKTLLHDIEVLDKPTAHSITRLHSRADPARQRLHSAMTGATVGKARIMQQKFDDLYTDIHDLDDGYAVFSDLAARKFSFRELSYRKKNPELYAEFNNELMAFIERTFGLTAQNCAADPEKQTFLRKLLDADEPEFFMIKSYENMSTALGAIGIDIFDNNEKIVDAFSKDEFERPVIANEATLEIHRNNVDIRYQNLRNRMDGVFIPIDKEHLLRNMSIRAEGQTRLSTMKLSGIADISIDSGPLLYTPGNEQGATTLPKDDGSTDLHPHLGSGATGAGVGLGFSILRNKIAVHSNPLRTGFFYDTRISVSGEGVVAAVVPAAVAFAEHNLKKNDYVNRSAWFRHMLRLKPRQSNDAPSAGASPAAASAPLPAPVASMTESRTQDGASHTAAIEGETGSLVTSLSRLVGRAETSEFSRGGEIAIIRRAPYSKSGSEYKILTQSVRFMERSNQKVGLNAGVPLHLTGAAIPVTVSAGASRTGSDGNVAYEILGTCPSYQILSFCELQSVINKSGDRFTSFDPADLEPANFDKMRDLFLKKGGPEGKIDSDFLLHKFFGAQDSILGFLNDYVESQDGRREWGSPQKAWRERGQRTEFDRIDDDDNYWRVMQTMRRSKKFAPGPGSIWGTQATSDPRPKLDPAQVADIRTLNAYFDGRDVSPKERMEYFLGNETGRRVFKSFCQILRGYEEISEAMKARNAYEAKLVNAA